MLNLTVTGRIIASNAILFLIAIIILATGLYGMSNMNQSFNQLVDKAMPMTDAGSPDFCTIYEKRETEFNQCPEDKK